MIHIAYCGTADIRNITNLSTSEITDTQVSNLITQATYDINADIGVTWYVKLGDVNHTIGNINGTNTEFTLKYAPIGDLDNDGSVGTADIEVWRKLASETHWTKQSSPISSIDDHEFGKITFSAAPSSSYDYILKYVWFPKPYDDKLITKACTELTSYLCFLRVNLKDVSSYRIGKVAVSKTARHPGMVSFYDRYQATLGKIRGKTMLRPVSWEMSRKMARELEETIS